MSLLTALLSALRALGTNWLRSMLTMLGIIIGVAAVITMIAIGGSIGSGIFLTPATIARDVGAPWLIVAVWVMGGLITLADSSAALLADSRVRAAYLGE